MNEYILEMKSITKKYGGVNALSEVDLNLKKGEVLCLCGENGAGKSTLMKILTGVEQKSSGKIILNGKEVEITKPQVAHQLGISIVHQELIQVEEMSVAENIFLGRYNKKAGFIDKKILKEETLNLMDYLGIYFDPDSLIKNHSIADRQLIEVIKALSFDSSVIVFDEPTASLNVEETKILYQIVHRLKNDGISVIFISHRMEDIFELGDRVIVLRDGELSGTESLESIDANDIIRMMIGREVDQQFPEKTNEIGDIVLEVKKLTNNILNDVSFSLRENEVLGIAGLVGAGRTELLSSIFGIDNYDGEIIHNGAFIENKSPVDAIKKKFAMLPEDRKDQGVILDQSIMQNMVLSILTKLSKYGFIKDNNEIDITEKYIDKLNIRTPSRNMLVRFLSGGNQQKVVLGKALASDPHILLLDEPTRGIDVGAKTEIYKIINELATQGLSIIVVSSDMNELLGISDRILVMHEGHLSGELDIAEASEEKIMKLAITH